MLSCPTYSPLVEARQRACKHVIETSPIGPDFAETCIKCGLQDGLYGMDFRQQIKEGSQQLQSFATTLRQWLNLFTKKD